MNSVHAKAVEAKFFNPIKDVLDEEVPNVIRMLAVIVDGRAPWRLVRRIKELRAIAREIVAFRTEMIIDDVQQDHEARCMRGVNEMLEFRRRSI